MKKTYITKIIGDGQTMETAIRPIICDLLPNISITVVQELENEFIVECEVTQEQHEFLMNQFGVIEHGS